MSDEFADDPRDETMAVAEKRPKATPKWRVLREFPDGTMLHETLDGEIEAPSRKDAMRQIDDASPTNEGKLIAIRAVEYKPKARQTETKTVDSWS